MMSDIFCLTQNGALLPPSVQATVLAKYSRSPLSAREIVETLTVEEADKFQDKWVVQYSHNSVAELATIPVCFEGVSIIASKMLESFPRAGYSEKSTRYQEFSSDSFITPPGAPETMKNFASRFYQTYQKMIGPMNRICAIKMNKDPDDPKTKKDRTVKARAFDNIRYLLPAGTGTNLAAVLNMLDARNIIKTLRGQSNSEFKLIGDRLYDAIIEVAPTLVKHTEPDYFSLRPVRLGALGAKFAINQPYVKFDSLSGDRQYHETDKVTELNFKDHVRDLYDMDWYQFAKHMDSRPEHSPVPQVFRTVDVTLDLMMDYGAYRDLQRHRRCEQFSEILHTQNGYVIPDDIVGSDLESEYKFTMESINDYSDESVIHDPTLMQYMVPLGYLHRSKFKMDLAELYYIVEQRTKPQGHISYRRTAYQMYELAQQRWPDLMQWCRAVKPDSIGAHT